MSFKVAAVLTVVSVLLSACATTTKLPVASTLERMGVVYRVHAAEPFTGVTIANDINGRLKTSIEYRAGLKDGHQIEWFDNGRKSDVITWRNGVRDGEQLQWYENGQEAFQGWMRQGKWDGQCRGWYPDGSPAFQIGFQDGRGQGRTVVIKWNMDNLRREFPDVQLDGEWIEWHASGRQTRLEIYQNGALIEKRR